jgi:LPXTG-motif cell wall-anchored protein
LVLVYSSAASASSYPITGGALAGTDGAGAAVAVAPAGSRIHIVGDGFVPGSSVDVILHSTPVALATVKADGAGSISTFVTLPLDVASGAHEIVATGPAPGGGTRSLTMPITVAGNGSVGTDLPRTGASLWPNIAVGLILSAAGGLLVFITRRRTSTGS